MPTCLRQRFHAQNERQSFVQGVRTEKVYIAEAKMRYEQTKVFRHDVKNHLAVLDALLGSGTLNESRAYSKKIEAVSESLSLPDQIGNPVVGILLGEKLNSANGVDAKVSMVLSKSCWIDNVDLCVIFSNALDNAIKAYQSIDGEECIRIAGKQQGDFDMLTFEDTCSRASLSPTGTGLANIKSLSQNY